MSIAEVKGAKIGLCVTPLRFVNPCGRYASQAIPRSGPSQWAAADVLTLDVVVPLRVAIDADACSLTPSKLPNRRRVSTRATLSLCSDRGRDGWVTPDWGGRDERHHAHALARVAACRRCSGGSTAVLLIRIRRTGGCSVMSLAASIPGFSPSEVGEPEHRRCWSSESRRIERCIESA
jgi:hypothetical protein